MSAGSYLQSCLERGDFKELRRLHKVLLPHLPAPLSDEACEVSLHMARTQADWLDENKRCYSHSWLIERSYPSQLPDRLKPKAERLYPIIVDAVFVSVNTHSAFLKPVTEAAQDAMCDAVEDCYANGDKDPALVRSRMHEAKKRIFKELLGVK